MIRWMPMNFWHGLDTCLALSYASRDSSLTESWAMASISQKFIDNMKEQKDHKKAGSNDTSTEFRFSDYHYPYHNSAAWMYV